MSAHWTDERIEQLKALWAEGLSASQVARVLGGVTRNAVIGKVHRMGLALRGNPGTTARQSPRGQLRKFLRAPEPIPEPEPERDPIPGITIANVTDKQCRWPYGDPAKPDFHLCGHPTITLSPYCAHHARKAFAPGYVRARRDEAAEELSEIFKRERVFA